MSDDVDPRAEKLAAQIIGFLEITDNPPSTARIIVTAHIRGALVAAWQEGYDASDADDNPYSQGCS